jgi:hypothetical protein|tara:strand:+ start:844 stop:1065 length:222 start_codon:yes stop_codon:yes gene_type:complete
MEDKKDIRDSISLESIINKAVSREQTGIKEYGKSSYQDLNLFEEIEEELLDQIVYSYLQILKIRMMKERLYGN